MTSEKLPPLKTRSSFTLSLMWDMGTPPPAQTSQRGHQGVVATEEMDGGSLLRQTLPSD